MFYLLLGQSLQSFTVKYVSGGFFIEAFVFFFNQVEDFTFCYYFVECLCL